MYITNTINSKTKLFVSSIALVGASLALIIGLLSPIANASSIVGVSTNIADVPGGDSFVMTVTTQNDGDVYELEVDHSYEGTYPEFSVYADETNPYGSAQDAADFEALGVSVTYSAASSQWTIDFGDTITQGMVSGGGIANFYFVLKDDSGNALWGSMYDTTPENTFNFDLVNGTGDSLVPPAADDEDEAVIPGVPNTSVVR